MGDLDSVLVGDFVKCTSTFSSATCLLVVSKVTKNLIICGNRRFRKSDGRSNVGDQFCRSRISIPTLEEIDEITQRSFVSHVVRRLRVLSEDDITYEQAMAVTKIFGW